MKKWDKEEEELLVLWRSLGWTYLEISNELNRSEQACRSKYNYNPEYYHQYNIINRDKIKLYKTQYRQDNKETIAIRRKHYRHLNSTSINADNAKRRAKKLQAIPKWADLKEIKEFYKNRPEGYHVDHYYPLQGDTVCGLHVIDNLQYLIAKDNLSKGNKHPENFYE